MAEKAKPAANPQEHLDVQAREQTGEPQVTLRIDERELRTSYANAFRTNGTAEEVMLDFGLNMVNPAVGEGQAPQITFKVTDRVILNYYSAKRLALTLGDLIRRHEKQFGLLELDVSKRSKSDGKAN